MTIPRVETQLLPANEAGLQVAVALLRQGQVVAFPTDTVYGVGALALSEEGVEAIYRTKLRPRDKALQVLLADVADIPLVARELSPLARKLAERFLPGALTLLVPKAPHLPTPLTAGQDTVGVRVPDHPFVRRLVRAVGSPLAATSANLSGAPSGITAQEVLQQLGGLIPLVLDGGPCPGGVASTVVDATGSLPRILREGVISKAAIFRACDLEPDAACDTIP